MNNNRSVRLANISLIGAGQGAPQEASDFESAGEAFIRAGSLEALCDGGSLSALERVNKKVAKKYRLRLYLADTVVFAKSGMSATKNRIYRLPKPCYVVNHLATVEPSARVNAVFLKYFLENFNPTRLIKDLSYPSISQEHIGDVQIRLPELPEQKRIAAILEKADRLRRTSRYARQLGDTFLQSVFLEMFVASFQRDASKTRFGELVKITGGGTPSRDIGAYFTGTIPWLTSKDMRGDYIFDTQEHITEDAVANSATHVVPAGSILVVVKSKVLMHRLPVAISVVPLCHGQDIKSIQCSNELLPEFARYVLRYYEPHLLNLARGANTEGLTLPMLNELLVPDVSLTLQQKFADIVRRSERLRAQQREAERQAEHLFQTVLHRAFSGGL